MAQQQATQANNPQVQAQANIQQLNQVQRQQQINQLVQQQQMESNIKQTQPNNPIQNNPIQNNPIQNNPMQTNPMQNNPLQNQNQTMNQTQGIAHSQQIAGQQQQQQQQQWNFNQMNQMQGTSAQNQPTNAAQPQQFFNQAGMNRFERPQMNNPTSKQALSMMLRQRHPSSFMNAANNPQQPTMGGLQFNQIQQQRQQQLAMRTAAMRNVNPAQMQANANQMNANSIGNPMMSGGGMVQQRQVSHLHSEQYFIEYSIDFNFNQYQHFLIATTSKPIEPEYSGANALSSYSAATDTTIWNDGRCATLTLVFITAKNYLNKHFYMANSMK